MHGNLEVRRLAHGLVHGAPEAVLGNLGVEKEPLGVRSAKREAENPRLDPARQRPGVEHSVPKVENPARKPGNGKLEADDEPLELENRGWRLRKRGWIQRGGRGGSGKARWITGKALGSQ